MASRIDANDPEAQRAVRLELARRLYRYFVSEVRPDYHWSKSHEYVAAKLQAFVEAVERKERPRLAIFLPPGWGKSTLGSKTLPAWILGRHPEWTIGLVSYGADLAEELSRAARDVVLSDEYAELFGRTGATEPERVVEIDKESRAVSRWRIAGKVGGVMAVGVGGALTGRRLNIGLIDDPVKGREEADSQLYRDNQWKWYQGTFRTRLEPGAGLILIQTRWHHDDLAGRILNGAGAAGWEVINLPALAEDNDVLGRQPGEPLDPERFGLQELLELKDPTTGVSSRDWIAQYQQKPTPDEGAIFQREWFRIEELDLRPMGNIVQAWDTAFSEKREADYSVCTTWRVYTYPSGGQEYQLLNVYRARLSFPALKDRVYQAAGVWRPHRIIVEDIGSGKSLVQELRNSTGLPIVTYRPDRDKVARAHAVTGLFEAGRVVLNKNAPWLETYLQEMMQFPAGDHDDQVDSTTMALAVAGVYRRLTQGRPRLHDFTFAAA